MIEDHCQATKQVQIGAPSVKDMDTKIINVLTRTQSTWLFRNSRITLYTWKRWRGVL